MDGQLVQWRRNSAIPPPEPRTSILPRQGNRKNSRQTNPASLPDIYCAPAVDSLVLPVLLSFDRAQQLDDRTMKTCHICRRPWDSHSADCRVLEDLDRMRRVHDRLVSEGREPELRGRMSRYLGLFGKLPCQARDGLPTASDCNSCGHKDVCVIVPAGI